MIPTTDSELHSLTLSVCEIAQRADREIIRTHATKKHLDLTSKDESGRNYVTEVDLAVESFLIEQLTPLLRGAAFTAEESHTTVRKEGLHWIIDPIDGTTNFMHGLPPYCISIALANEDEPLIGVIHELHANETFFAWKGGGAWLGDKRLKVSSVHRLSDALLCTGFPYDHSNKVLLDAWIGLLKRYLGTTQGVRRIGAAAVDMAYVAAGRLEAFYEYNLEPWDVAAGSLLVAEAGGRVTDFTGGDDHLYGRQLLATNGHLHDVLLKDLRALPA